MSDMLEMIKTRRSVRKYKSDMVPADVIDKIVEAGTYAATGKNRQSPVICCACAHPTTNNRIKI